MPLLAIIPIIVAVSSRLYPNEPATGATYLNVSPIMPTFVLAFEDACASTSAKCVAFDTPFVVPSAAIPNAVIASVTISDTAASSSPEAAARFMTPSMPPIISFVFQPAIAIYSMACPASLAVNLVVAPISFAFSERSPKSSPVAPEIACTVDICSWNSAAFFTGPL